MIRFGKPLPRVAAIAGALWLSGCVEADKSGTPHLVAFDIIDATGSPVMKDPDASVFSVSPRVTFAAVFDDLLDFSQIVNVDSGVASSALVTIASGTTPIVADTAYTPNGHYKFTLIYPKGPNITAAPSPGLPSGSAVTVTLNTAMLRGHNQVPLVLGMVSPTLTFQTDAFGVARNPDPEREDDSEPVNADQPFEVKASNIPNEVFSTKISVTGVLDMVPIDGLEATVTVSEGDPAVFLVAPKSGLWPVGAKITVTVAKEAADQFGMALGQPATLSFDVVAPKMAP
jgi:hypothetical protein